MPLWRLCDVLFPKTRLSFFVRLRATETIYGGTQSAAFEIHTYKLQGVTVGMTRISDLNQLRGGTNISFRKHFS